MPEGHNADVVPWMLNPSRTAICEPRPHKIPKSIIILVEVASHFSPCGARRHSHPPQSPYQSSHFYSLSHLPSHSYSSFPLIHSPSHSPSHPSSSLAYPSPLPPPLPPPSPPPSPSPSLSCLPSLLRPLSEAPLLMP